MLMTELCEDNFKISIVPEEYRLSYRKREKVKLITPDLFD
jgi:hypothetical protein